jgi:organic radical activating enzyme
MEENKHKLLTQQYSTWGDKLLQHTDVLYSIQHNRIIKPITIQLAPIEACDSDCPFCSVAARPIKTYLPFAKIQKILKDFKDLGAKSVELTGGGNPLLYRDKETKQNINDVIEYAHSLGYNIGIITNSHSFKRWLQPEHYDKIDWIRVSLIQLDEGKTPEDYDFNGFPYSKLAFSYIIYDGQKDETGNYVADELSRTNRVYNGTSVKTIESIAKLVKLHPEIKFVRLAGNCLIKGNNASTRDRWKDVIDKVDKLNKFFIKDIGYDDSPYNDGCYVGMIRPYIAPSPHGDSYKVYACTSHVLEKRVYDEDWALCDVNDIKTSWEQMNKNFVEKGYPYQVKNNQGQNWCNSCKFCYYKFNNKLLYTVANEMPDKNFP